MSPPVASFCAGPIAESPLSHMPRHSQRADLARRMTVCAVCHSSFEPRRSTARFCGDRCRKRASRGTPTAPRKAASAFLSVTGHTDIRRAVAPAFVTLRRSKGPDPRIVRDGRWSSMYRVRLPGGGLSDMVNLTRAKDALANAE